MREPRAAQPATVAGLEAAALAYPRGYRGRCDASRGARGSSAVGAAGEDKDGKDREDCGHVGMISDMDPRDCHRPLGVFCMVRRGTRPELLVGLRGPRAGRDVGVYGMPGGRVRSGESILEAAVRELAEEAGLDAVTAGLRGLVECDDDWLVAAVHVEVARTAVPVVLEPGVIGDWRWVHDDEALALPLQDGQQAFLEQMRVLGASSAPLARERAVHVVGASVWRRPLTVV